MENSAPAVEAPSLEALDRINEVSGTELDDIVAEIEREPKSQKASKKGIFARVKRLAYSIVG